MSNNRIPPVFPGTLNSLRMTYMNLFNQILDNSININCICKTTSKNVENAHSLENVFERNDFLSDSEDVEMENSSDPQSHLENLDYESKAVNFNRICDLSCFESMRYIHFVLKNCFYDLNEENLAEKCAKFEHSWENFKFLTKNPASCDYYGTTIFHYAASDNNYELLKYSLKKYPEGVSCVDSKGMTPLMRAVQRNSFKCVEFLLYETKSDLNGSSQSTYTPLWFAVSNGYDPLAMLLLNFNASPCIVNKSVGTSISTGFELMDQEDLSGVRETRNSDSMTSLYLFSPLRASIVYSRHETMVNILKFNANPYEIFGSRTTDPTLPKCSFAKSNEDYVNALKFFFRQFGNVCKESEDGVPVLIHENYLNILNDFLESPNVYRRMFLEFVKYILFKINSNLSLVDKLYEFLNRIDKNSVEHLLRVTRLFQEEADTGMEWKDYVDMVLDFMDSLNRFLSLDNGNMMSFSFHLNTGSGQNLRAYNQNLLRFCLILIEKYFKPKSLMELCRYGIRKQVFEKIQKDNVKYSREFMKNDHLNLVIQGFPIPNQLKNFLLYKS